MELNELSQEQLKEIVNENWLSDHKLAMEALDLITDQNVLKSMSYWKQHELGGSELGCNMLLGIFQPLWEVACNRITDRNVLKEIIATANVSATAYIAEERLKELDQNTDK